MVGASIRNFKKEIKIVTNKDGGESSMAPKRIRARKVVKIPQQKKIVKNKGNSVRNIKTAQPFGPVSTIDTAPVSIGNTIGGSSPVVVPVHDGVRVKGRDMLTTLDATKTAITGWTLVAGSPITPNCMVSSVVKGYVNSYSEYCIHGVAFHYVTAATTGNAGSVAMYINKHRGGPFLPTDSASFLPTVLSDHNTIVAPIWKNATSLYFPSNQWYNTDVLNDEGLHEQCPGEVHVYSRITENILPGYLLVDYDITFRGMQANPKQTILPISRMKYTQMVLSQAGAVAVGNTADCRSDVGFLMDGTTASILPTGWQQGDVYKVVINTNDATLTGTNTVSNIFANRINAGQFTNTITLTDGFTCFMVVQSAAFCYLSSNFASALNGQTWTWANSQTVAFSFPVYVSLVGSLSNTMLQTNI